MPKKRPDSDRAHAIELYLAGNSIVSVASIIGADRTWVAGVVKSAEIARDLRGARAAFFARGGKPPNYNNRLRADLIASRYANGESVGRIAGDYSVSNSVIRRVLVQRGMTLRTPALARLLIDRQEATARVAQGCSRLVGRFEDTFYQWLVDRGERPERQFPVGTRNIDIAIEPVAVEIVVGSGMPLHDPYYSARTIYLADRGWASCYVWVSRRTETLLPAAADEVIAYVKATSGHPSSGRQHRVIRGCAELAAFASYDLHDITLIPPSVNCPYHSSVNNRFR